MSVIRVGSAPDSWGVWFPSDPHQVGWQQYLDEVAKAGYLYTELGPQGFLPQDPAQLNDELAARGLTVSGGTVFAGQGRSPTLFLPRFRWRAPSSQWPCDRLEPPRRRC